MTILQLIGFILTAIIFIMFAAFTVFGLHYLSWFHWRSCKHCGHHMEYRGLKPDNDNGHYLFHCPKCGAREQIPKEEFLREVEKTNYTNPYESQL